MLLICRTLQVRVRVSGLWLTRSARFFRKCVQARVYLRTSVCSDFWRSEFPNQGFRVSHRRDQPKVTGSCRGILLRLPLHHHHHHSTPPPPPHHHRRVYWPLLSPDEAAVGEPGRSRVRPASIVPLIPSGTSGWQLWAPGRGDVHKCRDAPAGVGGGAIIQRRWQLTDTHEGCGDSGADGSLVAVRVGALASALAS